LDPRSDASPDGRWSVENDNGVKLIFHEGETKRPVATLMPGVSPGSRTFTPDSRWLIFAEDKSVRLWPLEPAGMIDAACARLRRRDLTDKEWEPYNSDKKLQPCSQKQP